MSSSASATPVMSQEPTTIAASSDSRFQAVFQAALKSYQKQTKKDLLTHPLASQLQSCNSTSAILAVLQDQVREFGKSCSGDENLTKWLGPTVNVLCAFSAAVSGGVGLVSLYTRPWGFLLTKFYRYFHLRTSSSQASVSSFQQVSCRSFCANRSHIGNIIGGPGCCSE